MVYSFDVFDTLITRTTATPKGIFTLMQYHIENDSKFIGYKEKIGRPFYDVRVEAERSAREVYVSQDKEDVTLDEIYIQISVMTMLNQQEISALKLFEIEMECKNVVPIWENIDLIKEYVEQNETVVLISDMYHSSETIRKMLLTIDGIFVNIPIQVSSELNCTKGTGKLYVEVKKRLGLNRFTWIHYGDNLIADVENPKSVGIDAIQTKNTLLTRYERQLIEKRPNSLQYQLIIGAAKNARLSSNAGPYQFGATVGAGLIIPYIDWLLMHCKNEKIKKLYFVARDGYWIKKIIENIKDREETKIECKYIYGSRKAWNYPSMIMDKSYDIELYLKHQLYDYKFSLSDVARRLDIDNTTFARILDREYSKEEFECLHCLDAEDNPLKGLNSNLKLKNYLQNRDKELIKSVIEYLKQEIDVSEERISFVEIQGTGTTQEYLGKMLKSIGAKQIETFYFCLTEDWVNSDFKYCRFMSNDWENGYLIEFLTRAPHGKTIGYYVQDGMYEPQLVDDENVILSEYGYDDYVDGLMTASNFYYDACAKNHIQTEDDGLADAYYKYLEKDAFEDDNDFLWNMPMGDNRKAGEVMMTLAPKMTMPQIKEIYAELGGRYEESSYKGFSIKLSEKRCTEEEREYIERCKKKYIDNIIKQGSQANSRRTYQFDMKQLSSRIIIYGAGKVGKALRTQLKGEKDKTCVLWVDANFNLHNDDIRPVQEICNVSYDQIVIAILNRNIMEDVKYDLAQLGVPEEIIYWKDFSADKL